MGGVRYLPAAESDLDNIWFNIALDSPKSADSVIDMIHNRSMQLATFPELGPIRQEIAANLRFLTAESYLILYQVADDQVEVVRIIHGARDQTSLF